MTDQTNFLNIADGAVEHLRRLMKHYPHLATAEVRAAVENWAKFKQWKGSLEITKAEQKKRDHEQLVKAAVELLENHQMEDVMEMLEEQFSLELDYPQLIGLIGKERYRGALRYESRELQDNAISFEQMAELWNSLGKPAPGGAQRWTAHSVSLLVE